MTLADAHMHLFPEGYRRAGHGSLFGRREFEAYCALRQSHEITCALAIGYEADGLDPQNNAYLRRLAAEHDWLHSLAYVDPQGEPDPAAIAGLLQDGHSGLAIYVPDPARADAFTRWSREVWQVLREQEALISFNAPPDSIAMLAGLVHEMPEIAFFFSHLGLPGRIAPDLSESALRARLSPLLGLAGLKNVFVKLSGLYATSDPAHAFPHAGGQRAARMLLQAFGPQHCLWASDFAPALDFVSFPQTLDLAALDELSPDDRALVLRGNLVRLLADATKRR